MRVEMYFSVIFFIAFLIQLFFGLLVIYMNPKGRINRLFFAVSISLSFWAFGFAIANSVYTVSEALFWRRISAIGWSTMYAFFLHVILVMVKSKIVNNRIITTLLYLPALICLYVFAISNHFVDLNYNLVKNVYGWSNASPLNLWSWFFNIYYIGYILASIIAIIMWRIRANDQESKRQSTILMISLVVTLVLASFTDVYLSAIMSTGLPQMAPVITLISIITLFYMIRHNTIMGNVIDNKKDYILDNHTRNKLNNFLSIIFFAGAILGLSSSVFPEQMVDTVSFQKIIFVSIIFLLLSVVVQITSNIELINKKNTVITAIMLISIPVTSFTFLEFNAITIWVLPIVLMILTLLYNTQLPLILITATSIITQIMLWIHAPNNLVQMDIFNYLVRIMFFAAIFVIGIFINNTYINRLKENNYQLDIQRLVSEISFNFMNINQANKDEKITELLEKIGDFFDVESVYLFDIDRNHGTMVQTQGWASETVVRSDSGDTGLGKGNHIPLEMFPWLIKQLKDSKLEYIEDINDMPKEAFNEQALLKHIGIKSGFAKAIEKDDEILGFVSLYTHSKFKKWTEEEIEVLKVIVNILSDGVIKIKAAQEIEYMAYYDDLTALPNRVLFNERLTQAIHLAKRNNKFIGVVFVDLDGFKTINDTLGHKSGDKVLQKVANNLADGLRKTDTVARFAGDEFLIFINNVNQLSDVYNVVEKIMEQFKQPMEINDNELFITASIGVAIFPLDGETAEDLIKNADVAMYNAKIDGKNKFVFCTDQMKDEMNKTMVLSNALYRALERDELFLNYQPQIDVLTEKVIGFEALLRWKHPELGLIPPNVFIPLAEMNGTINRIGEWVIRTAARQTKNWKDRGLNDIKVAINLSVIQFNNPFIADNINKILHEIEIDSKYLELEITESATAKDSIDTVKILNKLKSLGLSISIDDFGTEYSSLSRLKIMPIDLLKIDMQFVRNIANGIKDQAIIKVIINLAKNLGVKSLAEGVETEEQVRFLKEEGCDYIQGYYYYKPMSVEEVENTFLQ